MAICNHDYPKLYPHFILFEGFQYIGANALPGSATLPSHWVALPDGSFTTRDGMVMQCITNGELIYSSLAPLQIRNDSDNANYAIHWITIGRENMEFEIRARRQNESNYVAMQINAGDNKIFLKQVVNDLEVLLSTTDYTFEYEILTPYEFGFWMMGDILYARINDDEVARVTTSAPRNHHGMSLCVSDISDDDPVAFSAVTVRELKEQNNQSIIDNGLLVIFRNLLKQNIECPANMNWDSFILARKLYDRFRNLGYMHETWENLGFTLEEPQVESWFSDAVTNIEEQEVIIPPDPDAETESPSEPYTDVYNDNPYTEPYFDRGPGTEEEPYSPYIENIPEPDLDPYFYEPYIENIPGIGDGPYSEPYVDSGDEENGENPEATFASSISQNDITWTFDTEYRVGQFVNGDWWVIPNTPGGNVVISNVSPATQDIPDPSYSGLDLRNGTMINPVPASGGNRQGYDERAAGYNASLTAVYPLTLPTDRSVVSTISLTTYNSTEGSFVNKAQILTVLGSAPPENAFRPAYSGTNKTIYLKDANFDDMVTGLPSLSTVPTTPTMASVLDKFARPWIDHPIGDGSREIHPIFNMKAYGYEMSKNVGVGTCMLLLNPASVGSKSQLAINMTQLGIDNYHVVDNGGGPFGDGGLGNGRILPIMLAGYFLNNPSMQDISIDYPASSGTFPETYQTFYITSDDVARVNLVEIEITVTSATAGTVTGTITNGPIIPFLGTTRGLYGYANLENINDGPGCFIDIISGSGSPTRMQINESTQVRGTDLPLGSSITLTLASNWSVQPTVGAVLQVIGYEAGDIGTAEWGYDHAGDPRSDNPSIPADYRLCCTGGSWHGVQLGIIRLGLESWLSHDAFIDYVDRYRTFAGENTEFVDEMWEAYR